MIRVTGSRLFISGQFARTGGQPLIHLFSPLCASTKRTVLIVATDLAFAGLVEPLIPSAKRGGRKPYWRTPTASRDAG